MTETHYILINNVRWYCLSIFYNRNQWLALLRYLKTFYLQYESSLNFFYYRFSVIDGDRLDLIMTFNVNNVDPNGIVGSFSDFIKNNPSSDESSKNWISYSIWMHYDNNSIEWNKVHLPKILYQDSDMKYNMFQLSVIGLYISDLTEDIDSILLFLLIRLLKYPILNKINIFSKVGILSTESKLAQLDFLDTYIHYCPLDIRLKKVLSIWDKFNNSCYQNTKDSNYFLKTYIAIRHQYAVNAEKNKLLTDILMQYLNERIKE